jgi:hypothetical protein
MIKILDSSLNRQAILKEVIEPNRFEEINGENTLTFSAVLDEKASTYITEDSIIEIDDDYFDLVYYSKNQNEDGTLTIDVEAEHISYRLNNYSLEYFAKTGTPADILAELLDGTAFTIGTVELTDSVTYSTQEEMTKRQILMEFIKSIGGEVDFNQFEISIVTHRGNTSPRILTSGRNIRIISKIFNKRETDEIGNPLVAYTCEPIQPTETPLALGDEILLVQKDLGIQETLRIVRLGYDPYNPLTAEIEMANFISGIEDQMYRIATTAVVKEKVYNGCRIGPEEGFVAERSDGKAKTVMNATEGISIYSDLGSGLAKNFFVGLDGRIQAKGLDIDGSGTFSGDLSAAGGTFSGTLSGVDGTFSGTLSGADGTFSGTISASTITGSIITGSTMIAGTSTKLKLYDAGGGFGKLQFLNVSDYELGSMWYEPTLSVMHLDCTMGQLVITSESDIDLYGTSLQFNNDEIATKQWVDNNYPTKWFVDDYYSPRTHNHGNSYIKSYTSQDISITATTGGLVVRYDGNVYNIFFD